MWKESQAIKRPVDGRGGERGQAPERLGRQEPQQKVQESPRRLRIEGLETKSAPPRPSRASSARSEPLEQAKAAEKPHKQGSNQDMSKE